MVKEFLKNHIDNKIQQYLDIVEVMILVLDKKGKIEFINKKGCQILGYSEKKLLGHDWFLLIPKKQRSMIKSTFNKIINKQVKPYEYFENQVLTKNGKEKTIKWHNSVLYDEKNNVIGTLSAGEDITKKKNSEKKWMESQTNYHILLQTANDAIFIADAKTGIILEINKKAEELTGKTREELIGLHQSKLHSKTDAKNVIKQFKASIEHKKNIVTGIYVKHENGSLIPVEISSSITTYNGKQVAQGIFRDISERKKTEKQLIESEKNLKRAQELTHIGSWQLDIVHDKLIWSDEIYRIFGLKPQEFKATYKEFLERIHPEDRGKVNKAYSDSLKNKTSYQIDHRIVLANGKERIVLERCETEYDKAGKPYISTGTVQDITEQKKAELKVKESEEKLAGLFENMTNGFAYHKIIVDEKNSPVDYVFLEANKAFENQTGLKRKKIIGKTVTKVIPGIKNANPDLISIYGNVALTGNDEKLEVYFAPFKRWYSITVYSPRKNYFATVFDDITKRKIAEESLKLKVKELEEFNKIVVDRELKMMELKDQLTKMKNEK
ncbi:PAS domain S-box protein [Candidatus Woesearchaeota archaeon]|nr:PAS domain S-box protein [Candidatus Woesearchaeota archaeon]